MGWMLIYYIIEVFKWLIIIRALLSWFGATYSPNPLMRMLRQLTDPILRPISEIVPPMGGFDISPIVAYFALYLLQMLVMRLAFL